jgi:hypothetical protein
LQAPRYPVAPRDAFPGPTGCSRDKVDEFRYLAVVVELIAIVNPDDRVSVPEDNGVEAAEVTLPGGDQAVRREASSSVVVEQLVPEPR